MSAITITALAIVGQEYSCENSTRGSCMRRAMDTACLNKCGKSRKSFCNGRRVRYIGGHGLAETSITATVQPVATNSSLTNRIDILEKSIENLKVQKATPVPTYIVNNDNITPPSVAPKVNNEWTVVSRGSASNAKSPLKNFDLPLVNRYEPLTRQSEDTRHNSLYHSDCYNINFIDGDIYEAPKEYSYVQCVSQDLHCGAGIAAQFKAKYGGIDYMKAQNKTVCDIAVLPIEDERYLFNLITKLKYFHKPTLNSIERCLWQLKHFCHEFGVRKIAMPLIACGLDKQPWTQVQKILEKVMGHSIIDVLVYTSKETHTEWPPISFTQTQQVHNKSKKQKSPQSDSKNDPINPTNPTKKSPTRPSEQNKDKQKNKNGLHEKMRNSSTTTQSTTTTATVLTQTTNTNKPLIQTTQSDIALPTTQPIILIPTSTIINPLTTTTLSTTTTKNTTLLNATTQLTTSIPSTTQSSTVIPTTTINESITKTTQSTSVTPTTTLFTPTTQLTTFIPCTTQSTTEIPTTTIKKSTTKTTHSTSVTPATTLFTTTTQPTIIIPSTNQSTAVTPTTSMTMPPLKTTESTTETPMSTHSTIKRTMGSRESWMATMNFAAINTSSVRFILLFQFFGIIFLRFFLHHILVSLFPLPSLHAASQFLLPSLFLGFCSLFPSTGLLHGRQVMGVVQHEVLRFFLIHVNKSLLQIELDQYQVYQGRQAVHQLTCLEMIHSASSSNSGRSLDTLVTGTDLSCMRSGMSVERIYHKQSQKGDRLVPK
ncbi:hypothetical protein B566_EDAN003488 [Ephemera danica]|nr:hypothetical protein B566_EDAN003488 [Ephemera danica]